MLQIPALYFIESGFPTMLVARHTTFDDDNDNADDDDDDICIFTDQVKLEFMSLVSWPGRGLLRGVGWRGGGEVSVVRTNCNECFLIK